MPLSICLQSPSTFVFNSARRPNKLHPFQGTRAERAGTIPGLTVAVDDFWATGSTRAVVALVGDGSGAGGKRAAAADATDATDAAADSDDEAAAAAAAAGGGVPLAPREGAVALLAAKITALPGAWLAVLELARSDATVTSKFKKPAKKKAAAAAAPPPAADPGALSTYDGFAAPLRRLQPHQTLALVRGKDRGVLAVAVAVESATCSQRVGHEVPFTSAQSTRASITCTLPIKFLFA
jgi:hypothetical protein